MALRTFKDSGGQEWTVWNTLPTAQRSALSAYMETVSAAGHGDTKPIRKAFEAGWLTFASGGQKKRLAPIPERWEDGTDADLQRLLVEAS
jgi:hypothetical protein